MKIKKFEKAISEILGTVILLGISVVILTIIYFQVFSNPTPTEQLNVDIACSSEENHIVLEHKWGSKLGLNTEVTINVNNETNIITAEEYLDDASKEDGFWNLGEKIIYPLQDEIIDVSKKNHASILAVNKDYNTLIMSGSIEIDVVCDLGIILTVDEAPTSVGETLIFTLTLTNYGNINITNVLIEFLLPEQLKFLNSSTTSGEYNNFTGIWNIVDVLNPNDSVQLIVEAIVLQLEEVKTTQLAIIMDGSDTTTPGDWSKALNEIACCLKDPSVFPQNGAIELTFVQFGGSGTTGFARSEIDPTVVKQDNYEILADTIINISQIGGRSATACGILYAADLLKNFGFSDIAEQQIILLFSNGNPLDCCNIDGDYIEDTCAGANGPKETSLIARDYLLTLFDIDIVDQEFPSEEEDYPVQFNAISVGYSSPQFNDWLIETVWPGGYNAPPFRGDDNITSGEDEWDDEAWVCQVEDWNDFVDLIDDIFGHSLSEIPIYVQISTLDFTDPKIANNFCAVLLY